MRSREAGVVQDTGIPRHPDTPRNPLCSCPHPAEGSATPRSGALQSPEWSLGCFALS